MIKTIRNFFNGLAFGITETVPGVSGGTIAIILGFYFDLIRAINDFARRPGKSLKLLVPLAAGAVAGLILFSSLMHFLLERFSFPTMLLFIGLISGIIPRIFLRLTEAGWKTSGKKLSGRKLSGRDILLILLPFLVLPLLAGIGTGRTTDPAEVLAGIDLPFMLFVFLAGFLAAMALVLPGTSGSFILLILGLYHPAVYAVSLLRTLVMNPGETAALFAALRLLVPLALGVIAGGLTMVRLIERLLRKHERTVFCLILGFLSASVIALAFNPIAYRSGLPIPHIAIGILTLAGGFLASFFLWKKGPEVD